jgi:hypothetical protein
VLAGPQAPRRSVRAALPVDATNATRDSTQVAANDGLTVSGDGVGTATVRVGGNGAAFGVAHNTTLTVLPLLLATDNPAINGVFDNGVRGRAGLKGDAWRRQASGPSSSWSMTNR